MGFVNSSTLPATTSADTTVTMFNLTIATADTEQSQALPANTKKFLLKSRSTGIIKLAYTSGESGTKYVTIPAHGVFTDDNLYVSQTIYFQSPTMGEIVELITYQ